MKITAVIQARMGSTRLPGKVLLDIEGHPVLWHVIHRLRQCRLLQHVIVATTILPQDDVLEAFCRFEEVDFIRGSVNDVLDRFRLAAENFNIDHVVRITSDCPLIDPEIVDTVIQKHLDSNADYTSNTLHRTYPRGLDVEIVSRRHLLRAASEAIDPSEREHVTAFFYRHPEIFQLTSVESEDVASRPDIRLSIDTFRDLKLVRIVFRELKSGAMKHNDLIKLFSSRPELLRINAEVQQKNI